MDGRAGVLNKEAEELLYYLDSLRTSTQLDDPDLSHKMEEQLGSIPSLPDHYIYLFNYRQNRITYVKGVKEVLGYEEDDFNMDLVANYIHPDDAPVINRVAKRAVEATLKMRPALRPFKGVFSIDFRVRKANGQYIKIIRQGTTFEIDEKKQETISTLSICRDISGIKLSKSINWQWHGNGLEDFDISDILAEHANLVYRPTARELEVICLLAKGKSSAQIAKELVISQHTVSNHRKNILRRTGYGNTAEVISKAAMNGWLWP